MHFDIMFIKTIPTTLSSPIIKQMSFLLSMAINEKKSVVYLANIIHCLHWLMFAKNVEFYNQIIEKIIIDVALFVCILQRNIVAIKFCRRFWSKSQHYWLCLVDFQDRMSSKIDPEIRLIL